MRLMRRGLSPFTGFPTPTASLARLAARLPAPQPAQPVPTPGVAEAAVGHDSCCHLEARRDAACSGWLPSAFANIGTIFSFLLLQVLHRYFEKNSPTIRHRRTDRYFFYHHRLLTGEEEEGGPWEAQGPFHHCTAVHSCTRRSPACLGCDPPSCWTLSHSKHSRPVQRSRQLTCELFFASKIYLLNFSIIAAVPTCLFFKHSYHSVNKYFLNTVLSTAWDFFPQL